MKAKNIGGTISRKLADLGVHTLEDLREIGSVEAYGAMTLRAGGRHLPVCSLLYIAPQL